MSILNQQLETREALREIVAELQEPLPVYEHSVRKLKGGGYWIFASWESLRNHLLAIVPDYECRFYDYQVNIETNMATLCCEITILGVPKADIGGVPITELNSDGKDTSRGSCLDRAKAEAFKNAAEAWGVGSYLSDQYYVYKYCDKQKHLLTQSVREELNLVGDYLQREAKAGRLKSISYVKSKAGLGMVLPDSVSDASEPVPIPPAPPAPRPPSPSPALKAVPSPAKTDAVGLFPQNRPLLEDFVSRFKFEGIGVYIRDVLAAHFLGKPGVTHLNPDEMRDLMAYTAAQWAVVKGIYQGHEHAYRVISGKLAFFLNSQGSLTDAEVRSVLLDWQDSLLSAAPTR